MATEHGNRLLDSAVRVACETHFKTHGESTLMPWSGSFTIVVLGVDGNIIAAAANPTGPVYKEYGENLFQYALIKAVLRLHLERAGWYTGLDNDENQAYLRELLPENEQIYLGEAKGEGLPIVGASGCELTHEYRNDIAPGIPPENVNFLAGYADQLFAEIVLVQFATNFEMAEKIGRIACDTSVQSALDRVKPEPVEEPSLFAQLRRAH